MSAQDPLRARLDELHHWNEAATIDALRAILDLPLDDFTATLLRDVIAEKLGVTDE